MICFYYAIPLSNFADIPVNGQTSHRICHRQRLFYQAVLFYPLLAPGASGIQPIYSFLEKDSIHNAT